MAELVISVNSSTSYITPCYYSSEVKFSLETSPGYWRYNYTVTMVTGCNVSNSWSNRPRLQGVCRGGDVQLF